MKRRGPRMATGKVRRRGLRYLSPVRLVVFVFFHFIFLILLLTHLDYKKKITIKIKKFWKKILKSTLKLGVNENKWIEYTKELMKEISVRKYMEAGDKCNSVIRTVVEDQAW